MQPVAAVDHLPEEFIADNQGYTAAEVAAHYGTDEDFTQYGYPE